MKKSIETDGKNYTVRTVNGVDTKTGAIWVKQIREYKPLENGFNLELANHVYDHIEHNPLLWNQEAWRTTLEWAEVGNAKDEIKKLLAYEADLTNPACGTAMCFAGWTAELTGADWVADATFIKGKDSRIIGPSVEHILITREQGEAALTQAEEHLNEDGDLDEIWIRELEEWIGVELLEILAERGFKPETHMLTNVESYALMQLGMLHGDWIGLFSGSNDLEEIRVRLDTMAKYGPQYNEAIREFLLDTGWGMVPTEDDLKEYAHVDAGV